MLKSLVPFVIFLFSCLLPSSGATLELMEFRSRHAIIRYEEPLRRIVPEVAAAYPRIRASLENQLRLKVAFTPTIFLINSDSAFLEMVNGNRLVTAFARPRNSTIVINYAKMLTNPFDLEMTLKHELCHLLLHQHIARSELPKWLNEGVSQWVSEGVADIVNIDGNKILKRAVLSNNYLALEDISRGFPGSSDLFLLSYEQSKSIVEYIDSTYGTEKLLDILNELSRGNSIEKAVSAVLPVNLQKIEYDWHRHLRRKYTWMRYVSDNIYWLLFFFGAVVTVIGFIRLWIKYRRYKDEDGEYMDTEHE